MTRRLTRPAPLCKGSPDGVAGDQTVGSGVVLACRPARSAWVANHGEFEWKGSCPAASNAHRFSAKCHHL
ncbi:MAG: hypothetical protein VXY61_01180 [Bacteroidota bacterium]|nr:hypothetical protein [Bacteroidota bacterium]